MNIRLVEEMLRNDEVNKFYSIPIKITTTSTVEALCETEHVDTETPRMLGLKPSKMACFKKGFINYDYAVGTSIEELKKSIKTITEKYSKQGYDVELTDEVSIISITKKNKSKLLR